LYIVEAGIRFKSTMTNDSFEIEEVGTNRYCSLEEAQRAALPHVAELLACLVRQGIKEGSFVVVDGAVRLGDVCKSQGLAERGFTNGENVVS